MLRGGGWHKSIRRWLLGICVCIKKYPFLEYQCKNLYFLRVFVAVLVAWICFATLYEYYQGEYQVSGAHFFSASVE
jgi:hypothetical protein